MGFFRSRVEERQPLLDEGGGLAYPQVALPPGDRHIRLLELSPSLVGGKLRGHLLLAALDAKPEYEALSYAWGSSYDGRSILLNDSCEITITDNLHMAVRRLRHRFHKRLMWIDAVCINQSSPVEKGHQVAIMGEIYAGAARTLIWLGDAPETSPFTIQPLIHLAQGRGHIRQASMDHSNWSLFFAVLRNYPQAVDEALECTHPVWVNRTWAQQEYILSKEAIICCGSHSRPFNIEEFSRILWYAGTCGMELSYAKAFYERMYQLKGLQERYGTRELDFCVAAERTIMTQATDARDKVFALLGLIKQAEAETIGVDYSSKTPMVYARATYVSILSRGFDILETLGNLRSDRLDGLPSWSADFSTRNISTPARGHSFLESEVSGRGNHGYFDSMDQMYRDKRRVSLDSNACLLTVRALRLDLVSKVMQRIEWQPSSTSLNPDVWFDDSMVDAAALADFLNTEYQDDQRNPRPRRASYDLSEVLVQTSREGSATDTEDLILAAFNYWTSSKTGNALSLPRRAPDAPDSLGDLWVNYFLRYADSVGGGAYMFVLSSGFLGLGVSCIRRGDQLVLAQNARLPLVLRQSGPHWTFQGFAYVHGLAYDQLLAQWVEEGKKLEEFVLC